jgi:hypothetical protein
MNVAAGVPQCLISRTRKKKERDLTAATGNCAYQIVDYIN